jgi:hypothetical protein
VFDLWPGSAPAMLVRLWRGVLPALQAGREGRVMDERIRWAITEEIERHEAAMAALRADKPSVVDGRSDGKRVRYVRHEAASAALRSILELARRDR